MSVKNFTFFPDCDSFHKQGLDPNFWIQFFGSKFLDPIFWINRHFFDGRQIVDDPFFWIDDPFFWI